MKKTYQKPGATAFAFQPASHMLVGSEREKRGFAIDATFDETHTHIKRGVKYNIWRQSDTSAKNGWLDID